MTRRKVALAAAVLTLLSPAWADLSATIALSTGQTLDLDTGAIGSGVSGDLLFTGGALVPVGTGTGVLLLSAGVSSAFAGLTQADLSKLSYGTGVLPNSALIPFTVIAARTKTGKYSKILVSSNTLGTLVLTFTTFTANPVVPTIDTVQNNYGLIPAGLPNSALAPGSLIFIKGSNLSSVNDGQTLRSSAAPGLQNTISGVSVTVTVNGISLTCPIYYLSSTQIDAVLPGNTPVGKGTVFVTNSQDKSGTFNITIAQSSFGIIHYHGTLAATYDANNAIITSLNAANPGQTIVIWGSGVGGDPANDDRLFPQKTNNLVNVPMQVLVGGQPATILYRGRSQFPGLDQIVVTLPSNVSTGCYVSLSVLTGSIVSNGVTIPIAASGKTCSDPGDPLTPALVQALGGKPAVRTGTLSVSLLRSIGANAAPDDLRVEALFETIFGFTSDVGNESVSIGNCVVRGTTSESMKTSKRLDAGLAINVTGPQSSLVLNKIEYPDSTEYLGTVPANFVPATGGNFIFDNFSGAADVPHFSTILSLPSNFTWTNASAVIAIDRQSATVTWSGGSTAAYVDIFGSSVSDSASDPHAYFTCRAPSAAGQFTIPSSVLLAMPSGRMDFVLQAVSSQRSFTAAGLDFGSLEGKMSLYQPVQLNAN